MIKLEKYNEVYLEDSWKWLNDPEIKKLTDTPDFTREQQKKWFYNLENNPSYKIWGTSFNEKHIGVFGIKNIDDEKGEYWGYIGEKEYWGRGLGQIILNKLLDIACFELKLKKIYLKVLEDNSVAIKLYKKFDFKELSNKNGNITMEKIF